jgi:CRP-like cAMP-binding protein
MYIIVSGRVKIGRQSPDGREGLFTVPCSASMVCSAGRRRPGRSGTMGSRDGRINAVGSSGPANRRRCSDADSRLKMNAGRNVGLDPGGLRRLPARQAAGNPDDGDYLLVGRKNVDDAGADVAGRPDNDNSHSRPPPA